MTNTYTNWLQNPNCRDPGLEWKITLILSLKKWNMKVRILLNTDSQIVTGSDISLRLFFLIWSDLSLRIATYSMVQPTQPHRAGYDMKHWSYNLHKSPWLTAGVRAKFYTIIWNNTSHWISNTMCSVCLNKSAQYNLQRKFINETHKTKREEMLQCDAFGPCPVPDRTLPGILYAKAQWRHTQCICSVQPWGGGGGTPHAN
jgi:hypothetical protein